MADEKFELAKDPAWAEMTRTIKGLVTIVQTQGAALNQMRQTITAPSTSKKGPNGEEGDDEGDEVDADKLSNKELMNLILKNVGSLLDDKIGGVVKKIDGVAQTVSTKEITAEYNDLKGKHKDFGDWEDEMKALSKENPTLSLTRLYKLARAENPDKTKTLDDKYAEKKDESETGGLSLFGGYRPTGKTTGDGGKEGDGGKTRTKVTIEEAMEKAWGEAVAKVPDLAKMSDAALD